jgi:aminoglycoside/choline kinase family phosphotransferase
MDLRLEQYLAEKNLKDQTLKVVPLTGDASDRRYYRVLLKNAKPIVLALHAGPIDYAAMPFVAIAKLLSEVPVPVPAILHHSDRLGVIGLQDLGDVTLQAHLGAATASEHDGLYRQAVDFIARMQERSEQLSAAFSVATLYAYEQAVAEARHAFETWALERLERAKDRAARCREP